MLKRLPFWIAILNLLDAVLTVLAVCVLHVASEANPLMAFLIMLSPWVFIGIKFLFSAILFAGGEIQETGWVRRMYTWLFWIYVIVVINNLAGIVANTFFVRR